MKNVPEEVTDQAVIEPFRLALETGMKGPFSLAGYDELCLKVQSSDEPVHGLSHFGAIILSVKGYRSSP